MCSRGGAAGEHSACMWLNLLVWRHCTPVVNIIQYAFWLNALPTQGGTTCYCKHSAGMLTSSPAFHPKLSGNTNSVHVHEL